MLRTIVFLIAAACLVVLAPLAFAEDAPTTKAPEAEPVKTTLADGTRALRVDRLVKAPIADVWKAWATSEGFSKAVKHEATIEPRIGGKFEVIWAPDSPKGEQGSEGCTVQAWIPERLLAFTWNAPPQFPNVRTQHALVVVEMSEVGKGLVRITLTHLGFGEGDEWDGVYDYFASAWPHVMDWVCDSVGGALADARQKQSAWCYLIRPARADLLETATADEGAKMGEHFAYLKSETAKGNVIFAGPCLDDTHLGIVLFYADSPVSATAFMEADPAVKAGVFTADVHPIAPSLIRERDRVKP